MPPLSSNSDHDDTTSQRRCATAPRRDTPLPPHRPTADFAEDPTAVRPVLPGAAEVRRPPTREGPATRRTKSPRCCSGWRTDQWKPSSPPSEGLSLARSRPTRTSSEVLRALQGRRLHRHLPAPSTQHLLKAQPLSEGSTPDQAPAPTPATSTSRRKRRAPACRTPAHPDVFRDAAGASRPVLTDAAPYRDRQCHAGPTTATTPRCDSPPNGLELSGGNPSEATGAVRLSDWLGGRTKPLKLGGPLTRACRYALWSL
jgi:hypothetical protein